MGHIRTARKGLAASEAPCPASRAASSDNRLDHRREAARSSN
jgi:hypothetical protein